MEKMRPLAASLVLALAPLGCSGAQPSAKTDGPPVVKDPPSAAPVASSAPPPAATSAAPPPPASSAAPEKAPPKRGGGPVIATHEGDEEVTATYGNGGGKSKVPGFMLFVPAGAVDQPTNFIIGKNKGASALKVTPYRGFVGEVYRIAFTRPEQPKDLKTLGDNYVLTLQAPPKSPEKLFLVVAIPAGGGKATYKVHAPKSTLSSDAGPSFVFELDDIPASAVVHLTSSSE